MRDLLDILTAHASLPPTEPAYLATVVRVQGSAYRLPGARMLIDAAGTRTGSVSGGCLEADVARRARLLTPENPNTLVRYDSTDDPDTAWNYALGCDGAIEIFIERLKHSERISPSPGTPGEGRGEGDFERNTALNIRNHPHPNPLAGSRPIRSLLPEYREGGPETPLHFLRHCVQNRTPGVLTTIFAAPDNAPISAGTRFTLTANTRITDALDALQAAILADAKEILATHQTTTITYDTPQGEVAALIESIQPPLPLIICGAGHDALPLLQLAKIQGWHVTIADRRPGYARLDRFPQADAVLATTTPPIPTGAAVVIMNHHYPDDRTLLAAALRSQASYIGVLGPRIRTERMLTELANEGFTPTPGELAKLHAPIGLDLGAEDPTQVALAITAEILATINHRSATPLRDREGPIHTPPQSRTVTTTASKIPCPI